MSYKYKAFISYRHTPKDTEVAKSIQSSIEHFHIPKSIKETYKIESLGKVFRDQEELEMTSNLSKKLEDALHDSEYLIVICSNEYKESKWCQKEIEEFISIRDTDHVLCVLSEGEPPEIFPDILLKDKEPLACDYRGDIKNAKKTELPRLISALIGCGYDELVLRQERYKRQRIMVIGSALLVAASIALTYLVWSNIQINNNRRQSQINEARLTSKQAIDYYDDHNRLSALETILNVIPTKDNDRPLIDDTLYALSKITYAYTVPYNIEESWYIDLVNDISNYYISNDNKYLIIQDINGIITTYDLTTKQIVTSFIIENKIPSSIEIGKDNEIIADITSDIVSYNYLTGESNWKTELKYQSLSKAKISNNKKYICASDSFALQITDENGKPYLSLPLPEDENGYITDFVWSNDDNYIGVIIKESSLYKVSIFNLETYDYITTPDIFDSVPTIIFDDNNRLYVLDDNRISESTYYKNNESNYYGSFILNVYDNVNKLYDLTINTNDVIYDREILFTSDNKPILILGKNIYLINDNGNIDNTYSVNSSILDVLAYSDEYIIVSCINGYQGTLWLQDGSSSLIKFYPEDYDHIEVSYDEDGLSNSYYVLKDGNINVYEGLYDENITYYDNHDLYYPPQELIHDDKTIIFKADNNIYITDIDSTNINILLEMNDDSYYHLLDIYDNKAYIMICANYGETQLLVIDTDDYRLLETIDLNIEDFYISNDFLNYPLERSETIFTDHYYKYPSSIVCVDHKLYYHDFNNTNTIYTYDLKTNTKNEYKLDLGVYILFNNNNNYYYPSELYVLDDNKIATVAYDFTNSNSIDNKKILLLNLNDGSVDIFDDKPGTSFIVGGSKDILVYSSEQQINICNLKNNSIKTISYTSEKASALYYENNILYVLYPNNELVIYKDEKEIRRIVLSDIDYYSSFNKLLRFELIDNELFIYSDTALNVINLDSDDTTPLLSIDGSVLTYMNNKFIVYGYNASNKNIKYNLAKFNRYTDQELIDRAYNQLEKFN